MKNFFAQHPFAVFVLLMNILGFLLMGIDKASAKRKLSRISERTLMTVAALLGAAGVLLGMFVFHHKIRKPKFQWGVPILLLIQCVLVYFILTINWSQWFS